MPEYRFFASTNPYTSLQKQAGGADTGLRYGWCAAASSIWTSNLLVKGAKPAASDPEKTQAGILQVGYRWGWRDHRTATLALLGKVGVTGPYTDELYRDGALQKMGADPAVYYFSNGGHAMALSTLAAKPLWYDIERGLFEYDTLDEMKTAIKNDYASAGRVWFFVKCARA